MKRFLLTFVAFLSALFILNAATLLAQEVVFSDEFDSGDGLWTSGWIDAANCTVAFSIDNTSKLSGTNSYKAVITDGDAGDGNMWHIQRNANLPLFAGYQYTVSFMAVSDADGASTNILFEIAGDPYTKRIDDTVTVTTTPQTFTYTMTATENVPSNMVKFMLGGVQNSGKTIWLDKVIVTRIVDPALVSQWGKTSQGKVWPILNTAGTPAGNGSIGGPNPIPGWATLRGEFDALQATLDIAVVVTGKIQFVGATGGGSTYTPLRYALTYHADDTLNYPLTDSASWVRGPSSGYAFMPRSAAGTIANGAWGSGTVGVINNGNWNSSNSNGGPALATVLQAPRLAEIIPGTYNFAISVKQVNDTTNEIKWYLVEQTNKYWFGGTVTGPAPTTKFNGINFGVNTGGWTQVNLTEVKAKLGDPITVPEAPWEPYYIDQWGETTQGRYFVIQNDSSTLVGDGSIKGAAPINGAGQASIRGGFGQELQIKTDKALIVSGELELVGTVGGESSYNPLRYAITYNANDTLMYALTDSAYWVRGPGFGWNWCPRTGSGTVANGAWGSGTVGRVNNGNFHSTNSNGGPALGTILQAPRNAQMIPGTYKWAISVQQVGDTINEIRWYLIEKTNKYWFGGIVTDTAITRKLTGVSFNVNTGDWTEVKIIAAQVDYGNPIVIPEAPWQDFYIDVNDWGVVGGKTGGWKFMPGALSGNAGIGGTAPNTGLAAIRGSMGVAIPVGKILKITGKIIFEGGGFEGPGSLRIGLSNGNAGNVVNAGSDSARWNGSETNHSGYLFMPPSGTNALPTWGGTSAPGSWGAVVKSVWYGPDSSASNYPLGSEVQLPANSIAGAGTYDFTIELQAQSNGANWITYRLKKGSTYEIMVNSRDPHSPVATSNLNNISFALDSWVGSTTTALKVEDVFVVQSTAFEIPVELTSFSAMANNFDVTLNWSTATEKNNSGFEVQRQVNGGSFATVAFVKGQGTTTQKSQYSFIDKDLADGKYSYRLKQMDLNGQFKYSNTIEVEVTPVYKFTLEQNYPNPFNPVTTISYVLQEKTIAKISLINVVGEEVAVLVNEEQDKGFHKIQVNGSNLASGVYFYKLVAKDFVSTKKMILMK
jgi:hypothetical protein